MIELLAEAIHYAHGQGVVHRDLTPANVLLTPDGVPKISDFGLARCLEDDAGLTSTGHVMGTPPYMAPEVAWGKAKEAGPAADVYALGAILYELVTGQPPFRGTSTEVLDQVRFEPPRRPTFVRPGVPLDMEKVCLKCLAKRPYQRYATAAALADDLRRFQAGQPVRAPAPSPQAAEEGEAPSGPANRLNPPPAGGPGPSPPWGYELLQEVGQGGLAVVYKARLRGLGRIVAVKVPLEHAQAEARLAVEARVLAGLNHPNIVRVFESGEAAGRPYLILEYLDGGTLADRLSQGPQPAREAAQLVELLAGAVHYLHQQGITHRNLKPRAVMFGNLQVPKLISFGFVRAPALGTDALGWEGPIGTPSYMAPEQLSGSARDVGPPTDVYGLGAILYEMLTGRPPFAGGSLAQLMLKVMGERPTRPRQLNARVRRRLEATCLKALEKDPARRQASAAELADDLRRSGRGWFG
jgi:serine/threonine protein kinase